MRGVAAQTRPCSSQSSPPERSGDEAARFEDHQAAGGDVPLAEAGLPEAVVAAGGHPGEVKRGGAGRRMPAVRSATRMKLIM